MAAGCEVAEVQAGSGWDLSVRVRKGEIELLEEAGHRGLALRLQRDGRSSVYSTSDLSEDGLQRAVHDAVDLLELSQPDPFAGPAAFEQLATGPLGELDLFDPTLSELDAQRAVALAKQAEQAAFDFDPRIALSEGASFSRGMGTSVLVLSSGFVGHRRGTQASLSVTPVAQDSDGKKRRDSHWTAHRHFACLEAPEQVGREAARRTLARLGARKVDTCEVPVVFEREVARSVIGSLAGCVVGGALWRKSSYLLGRLDTAVASPLVELVDDPTLPRAPGSRAFDGEGLPARRLTVVEGGILRSYLLDLYSARKLKLTPTGSASRSGGSISSGTSNLRLTPGDGTLQALIASTRRGLLVTEMMGFGFNAVTGDYSRGAAGFWIENGELAFPVGEITISSNLDTMLKGIDAIANDPDLRTATSSPSFRVQSMTVSGT